MPLPLVAIVGAPNVGKSTLFNRLIRRRRAIVTDEPGVTRDRLYGEVKDAPHPFRLVDTGGLTTDPHVPYAREIERQAEAALDEAQAVLFVVDARAGVSAMDLELASMLRRRDAPLQLVANKIDSPALDHLIHELHELGLGPGLAVSAEHGQGIGDLLARVAEMLVGHEDSDGDDDRPPAIRVAIVGRPNVGKSSLVNRLLGEERVVVSEQPGTTRDAIDTELSIGDRRYRLIDTAGMRRRGKLERGIERHSVQRARQNIERCDVSVLVLDAGEELAAQDTHIAGFVIDAHKPLIVAVNKWDLIEGRQREASAWEDRVRRRLRFVRQVPMILVSALSGQRVVKLLDRIDELHAAAGTWVPTGAFNRWVEELAGGQGAAPSRGHDFRIYYGTQTGARPPTFLLFCNDPRRLHFSGRRHLENSLRERFGLGATPVRLRLRGRRREQVG